MLSLIPAWLTTASQIGLYLWLYTGYSKQDQRYDTALIREVLTLEKGLHHTVLELNKIIALAGLHRAALRIFRARRGFCEPRSGSFCFMRRSRRGSTTATPSFLSSRVSAQRWTSGAQRRARTTLLL